MPTLVLGLMLVAFSTPREQFDALKAEYDAASKNWERRFTGGETPVQESKVDYAARYASTIPGLTTSAARSPSVAGCRLPSDTSGRSRRRRAAGTSEVAPASGSLGSWSRDGGSRSGRGSTRSRSRSTLR